MDTVSEASELRKRLQVLIEAKDRLELEIRNALERAGVPATAEPGAVAAAIATLVHQRDTAMVALHHFHGV